jgi:hypothetical protein
VTIDERIDKLEFVVAAHVDQARNDYEENRRLWRDLRIDIEAIWKRQERRDEEQAEQWNEMKAEIRESSRRTDERIAELGRATDERIAKLVVAIGQMIQSKTS